MDSDSTDSGICSELEDSTSSSDEDEVQQLMVVPEIHVPVEPDLEEAAGPLERNSIYSLGFLKLFDKKPESEEEERNAWFNYMRAYVPLMHLMLEEYKFKWDHYQYKRRSRLALNFQKTNDDSDDSNDSVTSSIIEGFPNADEPRNEVNFYNNLESIRPGYYIFLSYFPGGWQYPLVKRFLKTQMGLRCFRSKTVNNYLKEQDDFRALIKFRSTKARADVFEMLSENEMLEQFTYVCVDADETHFNYGAVRKLRYTKGGEGLPNFLFPKK